MNPPYGGGGSSFPREAQSVPTLRDELVSINFSQSLTQILASLGHNLDDNPKEGFNIISACTDAWKKLNLLGRRSKKTGF